MFNIGTTPLELTPRSPVSDSEELRDQPQSRVNVGKNLGDLVLKITLTVQHLFQKIKQQMSYFCYKIFHHQVFTFFDSYWNRSDFNPNGQEKIRLEDIHASIKVNKEQLMQQLSYPFDKRRVPNPITRQETQSTSFELLNREEFLDLERIEEECVLLGFQGELNLLSYLPDLLGNLDILENDPLCFSEKSLLVCDSKNVVNHVAIFCHLLRRTYGNHLADKMIRRYSLLSKPCLTKKLINDVLVGISARANTADVTALFYDLKQNKTILASRLLDPKDVQMILKCKNFVDLSPRMVLKLLNCFKRVPVLESNTKMVTIKPIFDYLFPNGFSKAGLSTRAKHDAELLHTYDRLDSLDAAQIALASSEHYAKVMAYGALEPGMLFPVLDNQEEVRMMEVKSSLINQNDGMIAHFLAPLEGISSTKSGLYPYVVNFRGTQFTPERNNSGASLLRDVDPSGVGKTVFESRKQEILLNITSHLDSITNQEVELEIHGHSLGGADVQRTLALIIEELAKPVHSLALDKIKKIKATAHNPPGIEQSVNRSFIKALRAISKKDVEVELNYIIFGHDPVSIAGEIFLGAGTRLETDPNFKVQVMTLTNDQVRYLNAHGAHGFEKNRELFERQIISCDSNPILLDKILNKWASWDSSLGWIAYKISIPPVYLLQSAIYITSLFGIKVWRQFHTDHLYSN